MEDGKPLLELYPANAYHTYWALRVLTKLRDAPPVGMPVPAQMLGLDMARTVSGLRLWARNKLGGGSGSPLGTKRHA